MHNLIISGALTDSQSASNDEVIAGALDADVYTYFFPAISLLEGPWGATPTLTVASSTVAAPFWSMADAVESGVNGYVRRHKEWRDGFFKAHLHFRGLATGNFAISVSVAPQTEGDAFAGTAVQFLVPVTDTDNGIHTYTLNSSALAAATRINQSAVGVTVGVSRQGASGDDTAAGAFRLYGVEIEYVEARRMAGGGVRG